MANGYSKKRVAFAAEVFLSEMRHRAARTGAHVSIGRLKDYPPDQRSAVIASVERALNSLDTSHDEAFGKWAEKQPGDLS
jgi:hypothetical protein